MANATEVKERPIIMGAESVRAILDGRKTQTRRVVKPQPPSVEAVRERAGSGFHLADSGDWSAVGGVPGVWRICGPVGVACQIAGLPNDQGWRCPYGVPGDRLWVRETCLLWMRNGTPNRGAPFPVYYRNYPDWDRERSCGPSQTPGGADVGWKFTPSIHMPRWASRLTLEVTDVRVERVQEITEEDAIAEGVQAMPSAPAALTNRTAFGKLWDAINAKRGFPWDANPWVWVVGFRKIDR